jgi:hypothetical protein
MRTLLATFYALWIVASVALSVVGSDSLAKGVSLGRVFAPVLVPLASVGVLLAWRLVSRVARPRILERRRSLAADFLSRHFLVKPCTRCQQSRFRFLRTTPNGRSVEYQCLTCKRKYWAAAGSPEAPRLEALVTSIERLARSGTAREDDGSREILFETGDAPLPYELTTREPIPEAVRGAVWRRDRGRCVRCGSNQNLQFDHIIPVSKGGATTERNLQLLCERCNRKKGTTI